MLSDAAAAADAGHAQALLDLQNGSNAYVSKSEL
jgi:hypothetical protein